MKNKFSGTKAIILAGGYGTRLHPISKIFSKQLFPLYNKPMIYYPFKFLSDLNINEICIISDSKNINNIENILKFYKKKKQKLTFQTQAKPNGLPEAFILAKKFIKKNNVILLLGDNIFFNIDKNKIFRALENLKKGNSTIFGCKVKDPGRFGVVKLDKNGKIMDIVEKPKKNISNIAIVGLYFFINDVVKNTLKLRPSKRKELEITDLMKIYLKDNNLKLEVFNKKAKWFDAGTFDSILEASNFVKKKKII